MKYATATSSGACSAAFSPGNRRRNDDASASEYVVFWLKFSPPMGSVIQCRVANYGENRLIRVRDAALFPVMEEKVTPLQRDRPGSAAGRTVRARISTIFSHSPSTPE